MSSEILSVLEYMEKEKGIPRADMISTITNALRLPPKRREFRPGAQNRHQPKERPAAAWA